MSITTRIGIIGSPVAHSLSPTIHNAALQSMSLDITYELWETSEKDLSRRISMLQEPNIVGANVTIPFKQKVIPFLDEIEGIAKDIGAVNTIVKRNGKLIGKNTDAEGFMMPLTAELRRIKLPIEKTQILLVGAGGASRAIAFALAQAGSNNITIANRTLEPAQTLSNALSTFKPNLSVDIETSIPTLEKFNCIINATSVGMTGGPAPNQQPCALVEINSKTLIVDIVYAPKETTFLKTARSLGLPRLGGIPMLVHQAALSFEIWTGKEAPLNTMYAALEKVI
jgi:shikimate dehydrogenase